MIKPALLMLNDGKCFEGIACGACEEAAGEVVFTTGMAGYQETLTDPSFYGQIICFTAAHIGNYGNCPPDDEASLLRASGAIFHNLFTTDDSKAFPHWRAMESLDQRLAKQGFTAITGVDTRALTIHLREHGARGGIISATDIDKSSLWERAKALSSMQGQNLADMVSCKSKYSYKQSKFEKDRASILPLIGDNTNTNLHIGVIDYGAKRSIMDCLASIGMKVTVFPSSTSAKDILAYNVDGVMLSNGPGDPEPCHYAIGEIKNLLGRIPLFGICLGHQLLGLALGAKTYKLHFGHHGANQPVKDLITGHVAITSQNHGFCVDPDTLPANTAVSHINLNDHTLEGFVVNDMPAFSVQFHPEAAPGPTDAQNLFIRFREMIQQYK